jgi:arylsulfatase
MPEISLETIETTHQSKKHVILIEVDQWRGDCLSIDGHPVVHTPHLDELAQDGVRFSKAYSACSTCIPSRAALVTGLSQRGHRRVGYQDGVPWDYPVTLPRSFAQGGYQTHCVGKLHSYPQRNRLGFETSELHDGQWQFWRDRRNGRDLATDDDYLRWLRVESGHNDTDIIDVGLNCNSVVARPWPLAERLHPTNWVVSRALHFLDNRDEARPFFLYLSFHHPHPPYNPPTWAYEQYLHMDMPAPPVGDWHEVHAELDRTPRHDAPRAMYRPDVLQRARAGYYGHMTHIDHQINRLVEALREWRLLEQTWICFVSDHGEMIGDHHLYRKGYPYEGSARVPVILRGPHGAGLPTNRVCDTLIEQRDIMPTLLECAGLPIPDSIEGKSFLKQAYGDSTPLRDWLHGEHTLFGQSYQWVTDGREKYIWLSRDGHEQLFDLQADPQELRDLAKTDTPAVRERLTVWRKRLALALTGREEGYVSEQGELVTGRAPRFVLTDKTTPASVD